MNFQANQQQETRIIAVANTQDIMRCLPVLLALRPHLDESDFIERVQQQARESYRLLALEAAGRIISVAGYRIMHNLSVGKVFYIDDLVTLDSQRSKGHGKTLFNSLVDLARSQACDALHLDSGLQREAAHLFYTRMGMEHVYHHFALPL